MKSIISLSIGLCLSLTAYSAEKCATLYEYDGNHGEKLVLEDGDRISDLSDYDRDEGDANWSNAVSSAYVYPGCTLKLYDWEDFERRRRKKVRVVVHGPGPFPPPIWGGVPQSGHRFEHTNRRSRSGDGQVELGHPYENDAESAKCDCD